MSELQRRRQRDLLLTTLIDLLVQILFLLLISIVIVTPKENLQNLAEQARKLTEETGKSLPEISAMWRRLVDPDSLDRKYREVEKERDELKSKQEDLQTRLQSFEDRFKALGDKPCWLSAALHPETLFLVRVFDDSVEVLPRWPAAKDIEVREFKVPMAALERRISMTEFASAFRPVYEASKKAKCRHYVGLEILAQSGAKATDNRALVESYFYPRDVRRVSQ